MILKLAAIVAEYNPFHNGHAFQIEKTRQAGASHIVAVMGGNFLQRGEPAVMEKHVRTHAALLCGADLVVELPLARAMSSAERFAQGAVHLINALGCVEMLSFGAEDALPELRFVAGALAGDALAPLIRSHLNCGRSYASARQLALAETIGPRLAALVAAPNNILAIEYLKAAFQLQFSPEFFAVRRHGAVHDCPHPSAHFSSASHLRGLLRREGLAALEPYMPTPAREVCAAREELFPVPGRMEETVLSVLRRISRAEYALLPELSEGLENRLHTAVRDSVTLGDLLERVKTKRYPLSRIRRLVWNAYLGVTEADARALPPYLRVLGFNQKGMEILSAAKRSAKLPLSSSLAQLERENDDCARCARLEARSTDLYTLALSAALPCGYDYTCKPVLLRGALPHTPQGEIGFPLDPSK